MQVVESHGHRKRQLAKAIAQIVPNDADLEIKAAVSPQDIGKLKLYQKVQMKISACPYPEYGTLEGGIDRIATDTSKPQNATPAFYEVSVAPAQTEFGRGKDVCSLQLGMEGKVNIITREESVMRFLLRKARLIGNS